MASRGWSERVRCWPVALLLWALIGCESTREVDEPTAARGPVQRAQRVASERLAQGMVEQTGQSDEPDLIPGDPVGPKTREAVDAPGIDLQIPDPVSELERLKSRLEDPGLSETEREDISRLMRRLEEVKRPRSIDLTLEQAIRRAIENNFAIQVQSYNPAIEATRIVEAEAQFDAVYFANFNYRREDRPTPSALIGSQSDVRVFETGIRKLLSTGTQMRTSYMLNRTKTNLPFQILNPSYFNQFVVEFRQPLLRGFGLDFNRAQIELNQLNRDISVERMRREVRETIFNVEQLYWRLFQARRNVVVSARLLAELQTVLWSLERRAEAQFDVYPVQLNQTRTRIETREAEFIRAMNDLRNVETRFKQMLNDPSLNLALEIEIIPVTLPSMEPVVVDQLGEVTAALAHREELHEAKLSIEQTQIAIGVAKNQALPRLDVMFRYIVDGLGVNAHRAFSQMSEHNFHEYVLSVEFEWPIGNRGPEAALRRARLQQAQAIVAHKATIEQVIGEVKIAIRDLHTAYDQLGPTLEAAKAAQETLRATKERQERRDPPSLQFELDTHEQLAMARQQLLQALAEYNISLSNLERQKGTLLRYNNIVIRGIRDYLADGVDYLMGRSVTPAIEMNGPSQ